MRVFAIFVLLLMLPLASAIGDLNQYAYSEHKSADSAPILVEWFHGENDDQYVSILEKMEADGDITLIHWRTNSSDEPPSVTLIGLSQFIEPKPALSRWTSTSSSKGSFSPFDAILISFIA